MSGLTEVFVGHRPPGVYLWNAAYDVPELRHACECSGWGFGHVDGLTSKDEFLGGLGVALDFPDYYGHNLDALADCLGDLPDTVLLWDGWGRFAGADERGFTGVLRVLADRAARHDPEGGRFLVLLRGAGPDLDLPTLD